MQGFTRIRSPGAPVLTSPDSHPDARAPCCAMHGPSLPLPPAYLGPGGPTRPGARWHLAIPQSVPHDALRTPLASPSRRPVAPPPTLRKPLAGCQRKTRGRRCSHPSTLRDRTRQHASQLGTCAARRRASRARSREDVPARPQPASTRGRQRQPSVSTIATRAAAWRLRQQRCAAPCESESACAR